MFHTKCNTDDPSLSKTINTKLLKQKLNGSRKISQYGQILKIYVQMKIISLRLL